MKPIMSRLCWVLAVLVAGCSTAGYYGQSIKGQMEIWRKSRPIAAVLSDPDATDKVKSKLRLALAVRRFAVEQMHLPDNGSYTEYVDLERPFEVWSVFAAPELSLTPQEWCFLVVGCVTYRGYFDKPSAEAFAKQYSDRGYDVYVGGVPAYSTLGWFDDPVPNTVLDYPDEEFAGLIFHELAHQRVFAKDDTVFNESFAATVERIGVEKWLESSSDPAAIEAYRLRKRRDDVVVDTILGYRARLEAVYATDAADADKRRRKQQLIAELKQAYERVTRDWPGYNDYRHWFDEPINNAKLISVATYNDLIPAFEKLLASQGGDLQAFYESVERLARQDKRERAKLLSSLMN